jgi:predicted nucleic acid-binding protein
VAVPALLFLELLNIAGRWGWEEEALLELATALDDLLFEVAEPELQSIASWVARGLTAYDAAYVALAEERSQPLVTDDQTIVAIAGDVAQPLVGGSTPDS